MKNGVLNKITGIPALAALAYVFAWLIVMLQFPGIAVLVVLPFGLVIIYLLFVKPYTGLIVTMIYSFILNGISRYVQAPFSVLIDGFLGGALIAAIFHAKKTGYHYLRTPLVFLLAFWVFYTMMELFNPIALGLEPWFFAVRSVSVYALILVLITSLVYNKPSVLPTFLNIWLIGGLISALYGIKQSVIGLDSFENKWMMAGAYETHLLFGHLRVFSFYSDAGQFGAFMAFTSLISIILVLGPVNLSQKVFYLTTAAFTGYGMLISGTRGAFFVFPGFFIYLLLSRNFKIFSLGAVLALFAFFILKFTYIGAGNYDIQRMRSAVNPTEDPSFQVRLENQQKLAEYLDTRPFGGGIASSGSWGTRFNPGSFLAETPTDSWYVRIWAETGIAGLTLYLAIFLILLIKGFFVIWDFPEPKVKQQLMALYSGCCGMMIASYGNQLIGQFPTVVFFNMSLAFIFLADWWKKEIVSDSTEIYT